MSNQVLPHCIGFIMDGNRRWAKDNGVSTIEGHRQGLLVFKEMLRNVRDAGVPHAVFYAFSTENWQRNEEEVTYLMSLFDVALTEILAGMEEEKVHVRIIGQRSNLSFDMQQKIQELEEQSAQYTKTTIWIALSYGGRAEIIDAVNRAIEKGVPVDEDSFRQYLWSALTPDPDIIVRTSGEKRLSGFMTWGSVYSELYFIDAHWPALTKQDFDGILAEYATRKRRKGK